MGTVYLKLPTMKHLLSSSVVLLLGPVAVGVALGALAVKKGFILGALISGKWSGGHSRYRRAPSYSPSNHYTTNTYYTKPTAYYYSSTQSYYSRGKRSIPELEHHELQRLKREAESFNFDEWILDMSSKDQDDCTKKLICELTAGATFNKKSLTDDEKYLVDLFAVGLDANKSEVELALAAEIGKNKGLKRCRQMYKRCETSTDDILAMISTELKEMNKIQLEVEGLSRAEIEEQIAKEEEETQKKLEEAGVDTEKVWD